VLGFDAVADNISPAQVVERIVAMVPPPTPVWNSGQAQNGQAQQRPPAQAMPTQPLSGQPMPGQLPQGYPGQQSSPQYPPPDFH
jgi:MoxR-like ATPase